MRTTKGKPVRSEGEGGVRAGRRRGGDEIDVDVRVRQLMPAKKRSRQHGATSSVGVTAKSEPESRRRASTAEDFVLRHCRLLGQVRRSEARIRGGCESEKAALLLRLRSQ